MRIAAAGWLLAGVLAAHAQQLPPERSRPAANGTVIQGRVIADGNPVRNARVAVESTNPRAEPVLTDADGRFSLSVRSDRPPMLVVSKSGYVTARVAADTRLSRQSAAGATADITLTKGGAITGIVLDDYGAPLPLVRAVAERRVIVNGRPIFERQASAETDDMGRFRLFGLAEGEYVVGISGVRMIWAAGRPPIAIPADAPPRQYSPDAPHPSLAQGIAVRPGNEMSGINFTIQMPPPSIPTPAPSQAQRNGNGAIRGRILRADGLALKRARVELSSADRLFAPLFTVADDDGRYEFADLNAGRYLIAATSAGFTMGTYRQRDASDRGDVIVVAPGAAMDRIDVTVPATSAIVGRVVDEYGEPVENANVRVEQIRWSKGRQRVVGVTGVSSRQTDDFGRFRVFGLLPGRYLVSAVVGQPVVGYEPNDLPGYATTYFPGTVAAIEAQAIEVAAGQDALNIEFPLVRGRAGTIVGRVFTASGQPFDGAVHLVASSRSRALARTPQRTRAQQGWFRFDHLAPGEYVIQAATARQNPSVEGEFGARFVTVSASVVDDVVIYMASGSSITGRITFEGGSPPAQAEVRLSPEPADVDFESFADNPVARPRIHDDWTFEMGGISGPRRLQVLQAPEGWMLSRITVNGADVTDAPIMFGTAQQSIANVDVVLTNRLTGIAGVVVDDRDQPFSSAMAVAFTTDPTRWYPHSRFLVHSELLGDGSFTLLVPPGSYYIAAVEARDLPENPADVDDPEFLRALAVRGRRISVAEGEKATATLRVSGR